MNPAPPSEDGRAVLDALEACFHRYRRIAEQAMDQLADDELVRGPGGSGHSVATLVWHMSGNLQSRFTAFLDEDGEKEWRQREDEFAPRLVGRGELMAEWRRGWRTLFQALSPLGDEDLARPVRIRDEPMTAHTALLRALAHMSYHVGQVVYAAKLTRGEDWRWLSIPPGRSEAYFRTPFGDEPG
jgi:uncharacterized damage-inducible protein DinB